MILIREHVDVVGKHCTVQIGSYDLRFKGPELESAGHAGVYTCSLQASLPASWGF